VQYIWLFSEDSGAWPIHTLVAVAWALQGLELFFLSAASYQSSFEHSRSQRVDFHLWNASSWLLIGVLMSGLVQAFYALRIYQLSGKIYLMPILGILIVFKLGVGIAVVILPIALGLSEWTTKRTHWVPPVWMAADAGLDLTLLVCMCVSLFAQRTGLPSTDRLIKRMLRYSLHTGLLTSSVCIGSVISYWRSGTGPTTVAFNISAFSLYVTAMLANLHTRTSLRRLFHEDRRLGVSNPLGTPKGSSCQSSIRA